MKQFQLWAICPKCRKRRLFITKHEVTLPIGLKAVSKDLYCTSCNKALVNATKVMPENNG